MWPGSSISPVHKPRMEEEAGVAALSPRDRLGMSSYPSSPFLLQMDASGELAKSACPHSSCISKSYWLELRDLILRRRPGSWTSELVSCQSSTSTPSQK